MLHKCNSKKSYYYEGIVQTRLLDLCFNFFELPKIYLSSDSVTSNYNRMIWIPYYSQTCRVGYTKTFSMKFHFVILDLFETILPCKSFLTLVHLLNIGAIFSWLTPEYPFISICASQFFINSYCLLKDLFF